MKHSRLFLFLTFISLVGLNTFLNAQFTGKQSDWKGFKKTVFKVGEYEAFVVHNPWQKHLDYLVLKNLL